MSSIIHAQASDIPHNMTTTGVDMPGCRIPTNVGVVRGVVVRSRSVVGIRYDVNELMKGVTEVLCYGTAVQVVPLGC